MQSVYYIIPTAGIGGAEKRFIELWCYLRANEKEFDFRLIISKQLHIALKNNNAIFDLLEPYSDKINIYDIDVKLPTIQFQKTLYRFVCNNTTTNDILHFILSFPTYIFPIKHHKTVYSLTESSLKNVNVKGKLLYILNVLRVRCADILDPVVHKKISQYLFFKRSRIKLTPGSFVDVTIFKPVPFEQKENWFVFLGRFFQIKQVMEFLKTLPEVCRRIKTSGVGVKDYKFIFLGYGYQEEEAKALLNEPEFKDLPIEIKVTHEPEDILNKSKVFFSLQLRNNYPSKSLLEGIASGNIPLVTDVGTTRMIAGPSFSYYVPEYFSADDIADQLIAILSLDEKVLQQKMNAGRALVSSRFTIQISANYYHSLYQKL